MVSRIFFIVIAVFLIVYIFNNVKKNILSQDESILWMIGAFLILVLGIWPNIIIFLADLVGIDYAPSLFFLLVSVFFMFFLFRNSQQLSVLKEKNKELIQIVALLEKRVRDVENGKFDKK